MENDYLCKQIELCALTFGLRPLYRAHNLPKHGYLIVKYSPERKLFMAKPLNPLEKESLIRKFKGNSKVKLGDFCRANKVSETSFKTWLKQYEEVGIEVLARADAENGNRRPEGIDKTKEGYKREILRLRIANARLKKKYIVRQNEDGQTEYARLKMKSSK